jgi:hypothetical protein
MMSQLEQSITYVGKKFHQIDRDNLRHATYMTENSESFGTVIRFVSIRLVSIRFVSIRFVSIRFLNVS